MDNDVKLNRNAGFAEIRKYMEQWCNEDSDDTDPNNVVVRRVVSSIVSHVFKVIELYENKKEIDFNFSMQEFKQTFREFDEKFSRLIDLMVALPSEKSEGIRGVVEYIYCQFCDMSYLISKELQNNEMLQSGKKAIYDSIVNEKNDAYYHSEDFFYQNMLQRQHELPDVVKKRIYDDFVLLNYLRRICGRWFFSFYPSLDFEIIELMDQQKLVGKIHKMQAWAYGIRNKLDFGFSLIDVHRERMSEIDVQREKSDKKEDNQYQEVCFLSGSMTKKLFQDVFYQWYEFDKNGIHYFDAQFYGGRNSENNQVEEITISPIDYEINELWRDALYMIFIVQMFDYSLGEFYLKDYIKDASKKLNLTKDGLVKKCVEHYMKVRGITGEIEQEDEEEKIKPEIECLLNSEMFKSLLDHEGNFQCTEQKLEVIQEVMCRQGEAETRNRGKEKNKKLATLRKFLLNYYNKRTVDGFYHEMFRGNEKNQSSLGFEQQTMFDDKTFKQIEYWDSYTSEFVIGGIYFGLLDGGALNFIRAIGKSAEIYSMLQISIKNIMNVLDETDWCGLGKANILYQIFSYAAVLMNERKEKVEDIFQSLSEVVKGISIPDISQFYEWHNEGKSNSERKVDKLVEDRLKQWNEFFIRRCCEQKIFTKDRDKKTVTYLKIAEGVYKYRFDNGM